MSSSRSSELIKSPMEHTLSSFDEVGSQRIEILDSIGGLQMFTVKKSPCAFLRLRQVCSSVLDLVFRLFKHCKIQPVVDHLFVLELGRCSIKKRWNLRCDSTSCCMLICRLCAMCSNHRFGGFFFVSAGKSSRSSSQLFIIRC